MKRLTTAACAALLLVAACSDGYGNDGDDDDDAAVVDDDGDDTTTTSAPGGAEVTEPPLDEGDGPAIPDNPEDYATALIRAWELGDVPVAEVFATDEAVEQLFAFEGGGVAGAFELVGCDGAAGSSFCTFDAGGDPTIVVQVSNELASQSSPDAVTEVQVSG